MKRKLFRFIFVAFFTIIYFLIFIYFFSPIFKANSVVFPYAIHPFDISLLYPKVWSILKNTFIFSCIISGLIISNFIYSFYLRLFSKKINLEKKVSTNFSLNPDELSLYIGKNISDESVFIPEKGLFQNILVTGGIGTGKTSSLLYPLTKQLIEFKSSNPNEKLAFLILDVKGNYHKYVSQIAKNCNRLDDLIIIGLNHDTRYNPLHKPHLKAQVLANRLKTILTLFSPNNPETYWIDKSEQVLTEAIKLCRLYNNNYVTFIELHKLISSDSYYKEKIEFLRKQFIERKLSNEQIEILYTCIDFFENEFFNLDSRVLSILKSEISRITNIFVSDPEISKIFCSPESDLSFYSFKDVLDNGKIVVLDMNISEYSMLSKIISAYLKLDFQAEILSSLSYLSSDEMRTSCFLCDEYHEYVTLSDASFFSQSREARCINIVATQSYTSLLNTLNNPNNTRVIIQCLINKFWFRTDDSFTIEEAQKQLGKEEKERSSLTISENAKSTNFNFFTNSFISQDSSLSESVNTYSQKDFLYDTNFFTQELKTFSCLGFISDGSKILYPSQIFLKPYFKDDSPEKNFYYNMKGFDLDEKFF